MIDAKNIFFGKRLVQGLVQFARGEQIASERLLEDDSRILGTPRFRQPPHHDRKHAGRYGQVMRRQLRTAQLGAQGTVSFIVLVIAVEIVEQLAKPLEGLFVTPPAVFGDTVPSAIPQLLYRPA